MARLNIPAFRPVPGRAALPPAVTEFLPPGANLVVTPEVREVLAAAPLVLRRRRLVVVDGQPGCGKSTIKHLLAALSPVPAAVFTVPNNRSAVAFLERAHAAVLGGDVPDMSARQHENALEQLLRQQPRILHIDQAENAPIEVLRNLRYMLEAPGAQFSVCLYGTGVLDTLDREPMLKTWCGYPGQLTRMLTPERVATWPKADAQELARRSHLVPTLAALHPRFDGTDINAIVAADRAYGHGLLRNWIVLLEWLLDLAPGNGPFTTAQLNEAVGLVRRRRSVA